MLRFSTNWWGSLFVWYGGVIPRLFLPTVLYSTYCTLLYKVCSDIRLQNAGDGTHLIAGCVTFLLVFRLSQCNSRLMNAMDLLANAFCSLRSMTLSVLSYMSHGSDTPDDQNDPISQARVMLKVHVVRLSIAWAVSIKYHMRLTEMMNAGKFTSQEEVRPALADLIRIKGLLTDSEAQLVEKVCGIYEFANPLEFGSEGPPPSTIDFNRFRSEKDMQGKLQMFWHDSDGQGGLAIPLLILQLMRGLLMHPLAEKSWGYPERYLNILEGHMGSAMTALEGLHNMVMIPSPLPYLQLCKLLLLLFILSYPLSIDLGNGIWSNIIIPTVLAMALLGFEIVADVLENPVGDDTADISLYELIHSFEVEVSHMFDLSEKHDYDVQKSWMELGDCFEMGDGAKLLHPCGRGKSRRCFTDFFEWRHLPNQTIEYILMQSSDVSSVHRYACIPVDEHGEDPRVGSDNKDVFIIRRHVALKSPDFHSERILRQSQTVEDWRPNSPASMRTQMLHSKF